MFALYIRGWLVGFTGISCKSLFLSEQTLNHDDYHDQYGKHRPNMIIT